MSKKMLEVPPGLNYLIEMKAYIIWMGISALFSLQFFARLWKAYQELYMIVDGEKVLKQWAEMPDFPVLLKGCFIGFYVMVPILVLTAVGHYLYYFQGSKSIYLVKRLPDHGFLWRSSICLPLCGIVITFVILGVLYLIYKGCYGIFTPEELLQKSMHMIGNVV